MDTIWIIVFFNYVSFVSILIVLYLFIVSEKYKFFVYRTIIYLQISDFLSAFSYIMITFSSTYIFIYLPIKNFYKAMKIRMCYVKCMLFWKIAEKSVQLALQCLFQLFYCLCCVFIAMKFRNMKSESCFIFLFSPSSTVPCHIFFYSNHFLNIINIYSIAAKGFVGPAGYWCWIKQSLDEKIKQPLRIFTFSFIWMAMGYNTIIAIYLRFLNKKSIPLYIDSYIKNKLILIPVLMAACWILPTYYRFGPYQENDTLLTLHLISSGLNGFFNSCVYAFSPGTRKLLKEKITCKKRKTGLEMFENQEGNALAPALPTL